MQNHRARLIHNASLKTREAGEASGGGASGEEREEEEPVPEYAFAGEMIRVPTIKDVSSTRLRQALADDDAVGLGEDTVLPAVLQYIRKHGLFATKSTTPETNSSSEETRSTTGRLRRRPEWIVAVSGLLVALIAPGELHAQLPWLAPSVIAVVIIATVKRRLGG